MNSGIVASIVRMVGVFQVNIFRDSSWVCVDLLLYTIAESSTYFLAACFSTYRPLILYVKNNWSFRKRRQCAEKADVDKNDAGREGRRIRDEEQGNNATKVPFVVSRQIRGFDSLVLSEIDREGTASIPSRPSSRESSANRWYGSSAPSFSSNQAINDGKNTIRKTTEIVQRPAAVRIMPSGPNSIYSCHRSHEGNTAFTSTMTSGCTGALAQDQRNT